ncbi:MAG: hypothetical protein KKG59_00295 [Nanoarchaeota archaeon]|nr:hypothetical protein [Nanoarchaeota archaeon]
MNKKASLSINMIILFVIGLLVLIIVIAIVYNAMSGGDATLRDCANAPGGGGNCVGMPYDNKCPDGGSHYALGDESCGNDMWCCVG